MNMGEALAAAPPEVRVLGNLGPAAVFVAGTPESVSLTVADRLTRLGADRRFILSSGCDLPRVTPFENLSAFYEAARR